MAEAIDYSALGLTRGRVNMQCTTAWQPQIYLGLAHWIAARVLTARIVPSSSQDSTALQLELPFSEMKNPAPSHTGQMDGVHRTEVVVQQDSKFTIAECNGGIGSCEAKRAL